MRMPDPVPWPRRDEEPLYEPRFPEDTRKSAQAASVGPRPVRRSKLPPRRPVRGPVGEEGLPLMPPRREEDNFGGSGAAIGRADPWIPSFDPDATEPPDQPYIIGLTGPIGCGKSSVAKMLGRLGGRVVDADQMARAVTAPGEPIIQAIKQRFGEQVISRDGALDRNMLAGVVFSDPVALADLEALVHPLVRMRIDRALKEAYDDGIPFAVVEAIKLVEGGLADRCDEVWLIDCPEDIQRERLIGRGMSLEDMDRRLEVQQRIRAELRGQVDRTIDTRGTLAETLDQVEDALAEALSRADILPFMAVERPPIG